MKYSRPLRGQAISRLGLKTSQALLVTGTALASTALADQVTEPTVQLASLRDLAEQRLDAARLEGIRGRFVPSGNPELDEPLGVILWDEGHGGRAVSGPGTQRQMDPGNNRQHQSMNTTRAR